MTLLLTYLCPSRGLICPRKSTSLSPRMVLQQSLNPTETGSSRFVDLCPMEDLPVSGKTQFVRPIESIPVVVAVDSTGLLHVFYDSVPSVGHRLSAWGVVDGQVDSD